MSTVEAVTFAIAVLGVLVAIAAYRVSKAQYIKSSAHSAVFTSNCLADLRLLQSPCKTITLELMNLSQFTVTMAPEIEVEGLSVHWPGLCPNQAYSRIQLYSYVVKPNETYRAAFCVHQLIHLPPSVAIRISLNGRRLGTFAYSLNSAYASYLAAA